MTSRDRIDQYKDADAIEPIRVGFAELVYRAACKLPIWVLAIPGIDGLTRWAEETVREYRARERERRYARLRERLEDSDDA